MSGLREKLIQAGRERLQPVRRACLALLVVVAAFTFGLRAQAQAPDDAKRTSLEAKIAALQTLACPTEGASADPQVAILRTALDAYVQQYGAVLDAQIAALRAHQAPNLSADDQDVIADARQKKRSALTDVCATSAKVFTPTNSVVSAPVQASKPSLSDKFEITPSVVRAGQKEVSEQGEASVTIKNNSDEPLRLGEPRVCLEDQSVCKPQGEIFQIADGVDKCKNPLASKDQCTLKILFTPHRSFSYSQWLKVPVSDGSGVPDSKLLIPLQGQGFVADMAHVETKTASANHPSLRSVVGLDIGGATATDTQQKLFVDFALNAPFGPSGYTVCSDSKSEALTDRHGKVRTGDNKGSVIRSYDDCQNLRSAEEKKKHVRYGWKDQHADPLDGRTWWYFSPRITSIPQQASALSSLNVQGFTDSFTAQKTSLVQGVDVQGGIEVMLVKPREGRAFYGSYKNTKARLGLAWVIGGGFASPFAAPGTNPTVFTLAPNSPLRQSVTSSVPSDRITVLRAAPCDVALRHPGPIYEHHVRQSRKIAFLPQVLFRDTFENLSFQQGIFQL